jgi:molybdate transport system substrate-binding protein
MNMNMARRGHAGITSALLAFALLGSSMAQAQPAAAPPIAAASDLKFAVDEIAAAFQKDTGHTVRLSYGSSGNFYRQIAQDAPFELFMSADEDFVFRLADRNLTVDRGVLYATGRIVLFVPSGAALKADAQLADLRRALEESRIRRFAIANPQHAPYGRAAMEALKSAGLWDAIQPRLVLGENVSQAAQFAASGATQGGIFAYSLALAPVFARVGTHVLIPEHMHGPLRQRMVLTHKAGAVARAFHDYLQQPAARAVFRRHGFVLPGEAPN